PCSGPNAKATLCGYRRRRPTNQSVPHRAIARPARQWLREFTEQYTITLRASTDSKLALRKISRAPTALCVRNEERGANAVSSGFDIAYRVHPQALRCKRRPLVVLDSTHATGDDRATGGERFHHGDGQSFPVR